MYRITLRKSHYKWEKLLNVFVDCSSEKHFSFYCDQLFRCKILSSMLIALETCLIFTFVSVGKILKWNNSKKPSKLYAKEILLPVPQREINFWLSLSAKLHWNLCTRSWVCATIDLVKSHCHFASQVAGKFKTHFHNLLSHWKPRTRILALLHRHN